MVSFGIDIDVCNWVRAVIGGFCLVSTWSARRDKLLLVRLRREASYGLIYIYTARFYFHCATLVASYR